MKLFAAFIFIFLLLVSSCANEKEIQNAIGESLKEQKFKIQVSTDTVLTSENGTKIFIRKNTFPQDVKEVELQFKEALTLAEMIKAGLTTTSNDKILSTGGMVYISASANGEEIKLQNPIKIQVPAKNYDPEMQLFKGDITENGINWKLVGDLEPDPTKQAYLRGKQIFEFNCTACHKIGEVLIGPNLAGVKYRWKDKNRLYAFTKNSQAVINSGDQYARALFAQYNGTIMPPQDLNNSQLDDLYYFIEKESEEYSSQQPSAVNLLTGDDFDTLSTNRFDSAGKDTSATFSEIDYYTFFITGYDWYNCDRFLESPDNVIPNITVNFSDENPIDQILIVIPELKAIIPCDIKDNKLTDTWIEFRFPKNKKAIVIFRKQENIEESYFYHPIIFNENPIKINVDKYEKTYKDIEKLVN